MNEPWQDRPTLSRTEIFQPNFARETRNQSSIEPIALTLTYPYRDVTRPSSIIFNREPLYSMLFKFFIIALFEFFQVGKALLDRHLFSNLLTVLGNKVSF